MANHVIEQTQIDIQRTFETVGRVAKFASANLASNRSTFFNASTSKSAEAPAETVEKIADLLSQMFMKAPKSQSQSKEQSSAAVSELHEIHNKLNEVLEGKMPANVASSDEPTLSKPYIS